MAATRNTGFRSSKRALTASDIIAERFGGDAEGLSDYERLELAATVVCSGKVSSKNLDQDVVRAAIVLKTEGFIGLRALNEE